MSSPDWKSFLKVCEERERYKAALEKIACTPNRQDVEDDVEDKIEMRRIAEQAIAKIARD